MCIFRILVPVISSELLPVRRPLTRHLTNYEPAPAFNRKLDQPQASIAEAEGLRRQSLNLLRMNRNRRFVYILDEDPEVIDLFVLQIKE